MVVEKGLSSVIVLSTKTIQYYRNSSHADHYELGRTEYGSDLKRICLKTDSLLVSPDVKKRVITFTSFVNAVLPDNG